MFEGLQIKCLLELNCLCVLFLLTQRMRSSLSGPGWWKVPTTYAVKGCYEMDLLLTAVGVENREESPVELFFIMDATWPQGAAAVRWNRITSSLTKFLHCSCTTIKKTIQVRRTRHAGHCWRSRDKLLSDILLWTSSHGWVKAGRPVRTYIQQLCADTGCSPEDLQEAMDNREEWRERVREIRTGGGTWWWWWF